MGVGAREERSSCEVVPYHRRTIEGQIQPVKFINPPRLEGSTSHHRRRGTTSLFEGRKCDAPIQRSQAINPFTAYEKLPVSPEVARSAAY